MKLIECYIDNFGKLSSVSFRFSSGLNAFCEENGYGKTTLAAFIKAMLYGLEDTKKAKLDDNDRRKYEPWQGGRWGGALSFSASGKSYRIERVFSKKAAEDECRVFDLETGKEYYGFKNDIGSSLFGIDRDGFERTVFLSEKNLSDKCDNKTISAKLSDLSGVDGDLSELDVAIKNLEEDRKFYYRQGGAGAIGEVRDRISALEFKKANLSALEKRHEDDGKGIQELEDYCLDLRKKAEAAKKEENAQAIKRELFSEYKKRVSEYENEKRREEELARFFRNGTPTMAQLYEAKSCAAEAKRLFPLVSAPNSSTASKYTQADVERLTLINAKLRESENKIFDFHAKKRDTGAENSKSKLPFLLFGLFLMLAGIVLGATLSPLFFLVLIPGIISLVLPLSNTKAKRESQKSIRELEELSRARDALKNELHSFLSELGLHQASPEEAAEAIRRAVYESTEREKEFFKNKSAYEECLKKAKDFLSAFDGELDFNVIEARLTEYKACSENAHRLLLACRKMREEYSFDEMPSEASRQGTPYAALLSEKERELALLKHRYRLDETELLALEDTSAELEELYETEEKYKKKLSVIKKTKEFLEKAKDNLNSRYLGKTKASFSKYTELISKAEGSFNLDTSFTLTKTEGGQTKQKEAYSKGTRDLYSFALRLALIDSLYEKEKPFIMLDDPFAYFDDEKLEEAKLLVSELAKSGQIIYFTASEARVPK